MSTNDDEELARALQKRYEEEAQKEDEKPTESADRRRVPHRSSKRSNVRRLLKREQIADNSLDLNNQEQAVPPRRPKRISNNRREPFVSEEKDEVEDSRNKLKNDDIPDTSKDEAIARRLSGINFQRKIPRETSEKKEKGKAEEISNTAVTTNVENPDTSNDEAIARRLSGVDFQRKIPRETSGLKEDNVRRITDRSKEDNALGGNQGEGRSENLDQVSQVRDEIEKGQCNTSKDEELANSLSQNIRGRKRPSVRVMQQSTATTNMENIDTSNDEAIARRLSGINFQRKTSGKKEKGKVEEMSSILRREDTVGNQMEGRNEILGQIPQAGTETENEDQPDTSKDEELAKLLSKNEGRGRKRQSSRASLQSAATNNVENLDTSKDAELARKLSSKENQQRRRVPTRKLVLQENKHEESISRNINAVASDQHSLLNSLDPTASKEEGILETVREGSIDEELSAQPAEREKHASQFLMGKLRILQQGGGGGGLNIMSTVSKNEEEEKKKQSESTNEETTLLIAKQSVKQKFAKMGENKETKVKNDQDLALKLQQELKDEELARELSEKEKRRQQRAANIARKKNVSRRHREENVVDKNGHERNPLNQRQNRPQQRGNNGNYSGDELGGHSSHTTASNSSSDDDRRKLKKPSRKEKKRKSYQYRTNRGGIKENGCTSNLYNAPNQLLIQKQNQEVKDANLAMSFSVNQRQRMPIFQIEAVDNDQKQCDITRTLSLTLPVIVIMAAVVGLAFAFTSSEGLPNLVTGEPPIVDEPTDPFSGKGPTDANKWTTNGEGGLTLIVLDALEGKWRRYFDKAIHEWDSGYPDALNLIVKRVGRDTNCTEEKGKLKVCNGDYGETKWRGLNEVVLQRDYIISSVAKLNEYYLEAADEDQRQYTICHEIGHGFGLPHTDEIFHNEDLGNCMDYTSRPENNKSPDKMNFSFLFDLYGSTDSKRSALQDAEMESIPDFPHEFHHRIAEARLQISNDMVSSGGTFPAAILERTEQSESIIVDLGNDAYYVQNMLLVEKY